MALMRKRREQRTSNREREKRKARRPKMVQIDADELAILRTRAAIGRPSNEAAVALDRNLLEAVNRVLESTGSSVADYLELQLIKFTRNKAIHGLNDKLTFGQYEGLEVAHVCQTDLSYMHWLVVEQKSNKFKPEVRTYVESLAEREDRSDCHLTWDDIR